MSLKRPTLAGILAGISLASAALAQPGPWTLARALGVLAGLLVAVLGAVARDHAMPPAAVPAVDLETVRAEIAHVLARASTVPPDASEEVVRAAAERVLVGSDRPGSVAAAVAKGEP